MWLHARCGWGSEVIDSFVNIAWLSGSAFPTNHQACSSVAALKALLMKHAHLWFLPE